ncbi:MAG: triphosphoribosyl-dephospho-CoA synthase [Clostridia bacterium]|nr:triphosphoribosyl-dephospho-CoA synthase [Clostridia bacterium]
MFNDILTARENRRKIIEKFSKTTDVVSIKANVVGPIKNLPSSRLLLSYFTKLVENLGVENLVYLPSPDGDTVIGETKSGVNLKEKAVFLEENDSLGRFIDIDVTLKGQTESLTRSTMRKCFLCSNIAFVCGKNKTHSIKELLDFFNGKTYEEIHKKLQNILLESLLGELNLENKFGLVTPTDNGSHIDLNYRLMENASKEISRVLPKAFFVGLNSSQIGGMFDSLREVGLNAEEVMFKTTLGANAYKGFIFMACVLLGACGYAIKSGLSYDEIYLTVKEICKDLDSQKMNTFGYKAYQDGFGGIRKSAKDGFLVVDYAKTLIKEDNLLEVLTKIVGKIDDSVLLKRTVTIEKYSYYKNLISTANTNDKESVKILPSNAKTITSV